MCCVRKGSRIGRLCRLIRCVKIVRIESKLDGINGFQRVRRRVKVQAGAG